LGEHKVAESAKIGMVTVTTNSGKDIDLFMRSTLSQHYSNFLLYIIDNCSTDTTLHQVSQYQDPRVTVIANDSNLGIARSNNRGITAALQADCEYILLINNDTEFDASLIGTLLAQIEDLQCDMIIPKIMYYDRPDIIWCAGGVFRRWRGHSAIHRGENCRDTGQFDQPCRVDYAPTCCMLIRRQVFESLGLMDPCYFLYFDDTDFCLRALRHGLRLYYTPSAELLHKVSSQTGGRGSTFQTRYQTRSHVYYLAKNFGLLHCLYFLPLYQLKIAVKLLTGQLSIEKFRVSQTGFWEGVRMSLSAPRGQERSPVARESIRGGV